MQIEEAAPAGVRTRDRVVEQLLRGGPTPAAVLAEALGVGPAAVRRHLDALVDSGVVEARTQRVVGPRGRGRPPRLFALTEAGHRAAEGGRAVAYDEVAREALRFLREAGGDEAVRAFAERRVADLEARLADVVADLPVEGRAEALAQALSGVGYPAEAVTSPVAPHAVQLCQHHCPVQAVAAEFPELCHAETAVFERVLGTHVQRLATLAEGDGVCTTHVPVRGPAAASHPSDAATAAAASSPRRTA